MFKFYGFVLTFIALLLTAGPAWAGKLVSWRFESGQNRLLFYTDSAVQPTAQLIPNPTRIVVDLPNVTLGRPTVNQPIGGTISNLRVAQFDAYTTRLVIELAPGYTVDPQKVVVKGRTATQWEVVLPPPQYGAPPNPTPQNSTPQSFQPSRSNTASRSPVGDVLQVTPNGIVVRLDRNGNNSDIDTSRSNDGQIITFRLPGATLPKSLAGQTFAINQYGVGDLQFIAESGNPQIRLSVNPSSPTWQASYSRLGGLVLLPRGGMRSLEGLTPPPSTGQSLGQTVLTANGSGNSPNFAGARVTRLELTRDNRQLVIQGDRPLQARGSLNRLSGDYEIRIDNAQLQPNLPAPQMGNNSPIYQLRLRQEGNTVVIAVQPSAGSRFGNLITGGDGRIGLELFPGFGGNVGSRPPRMIVTPSNPGGNSGGIPLQIISPPPGSFPRMGSTLPPRRPFPSNNFPSNNFPSTSLPSTNFPRPTRGRRLIFIDPGHGGKDPGAIGLNGIQEKDVILPISQYVASYLEQQGMQVIMARNADYFVSLQGRTDMANRANADLFVSIHANSMGASRPDVSGLEVYYFGDRGLSDAIHRSIVRSVEVRDRGVRRARFYVLRHSRMPSTLVEVGFVTGYDDADKLINPSYQQQMAQAIARGILDYLQGN